MDPALGFVNSVGQRWMTMGCWRYGLTVNVHTVQWTCNSSRRATPQARFSWEIGRWANRQQQFGAGFSARTVLGNLRGEQTRLGRIHRVARSRNQAVRCACAIGRTGVHENEPQRKYTIRKSHARRLRGPAETREHRDSATHRTRRRSSTGGRSGLEGVDQEVAAAALSRRQRGRLEPDAPLCSRRYV